MQYWWHHKTQHAPFGLSVMLLLGFCGLLGLGVWHLFYERQIGLPEIILPEVLNTSASPEAVRTTYRNELNDLLVRLERPDASLVVDIDQGLFSVRVPKEKLDAHLAAVLAWNHLDKTKLTPAQLAEQTKQIISELLK